MIKTHLQFQETMGAVPIVGFLLANGQTRVKEAKENNALTAIATHILMACAIILTAVLLKILSSCCSENVLITSGNGKSLEHEGKWLVISGECIGGIYDDRGKAYDYGVKIYKLGHFLLQQVQLEKDEQQKFYSRVYV